MKIRTLIEGIEKKGTTRGEKLASALKRKVSDALGKAGFDGNGRFETIGKALNKLSEVLTDNGLQNADVMNADLFREESGSKQFGLEFVTDDPFSPMPVSNSLISFSWHYKKEIDAYEVLVYLS